jgi:hypothetical protein
MYLKFIFKRLKVKFIVVHLYLREFEVSDIARFINVNHQPIPSLFWNKFIPGNSKISLFSNFLIQNGIVKI